MKSLFDCKEDEHNRIKKKSYEIFMAWRGIVQANWCSGIYISKSLSKERVLFTGWDMYFFQSQHLRTNELREKNDKNVYNFSTITSPTLVSLRPVASIWVECVKFKRQA